MSKLFDGSDEPLTYAQALVLVAAAGNYPTEAHKAEVVRAVQLEHGLVPPDAVPVYADARDQTLVDQDRELADLKAKLAAREAADLAAEKDAEIARLKAQLDGPAEVTEQ